MNLQELLYVFVLFSVAGWLMECAYRSWKARRWINPGLLTGPYLPIYGFGAVVLNTVRLQAPDPPFLFLMATVSSAFPGVGTLLLSKSFLAIGHWLIQGIGFFIVTTTLEWMTGWALKRFLNVRLWDYSDQRWTLGGHICLKYSLIWVALAFALEYVLLPGALFLHEESPLPWPVLTLVLANIMAIDFTRVTARLLAEKPGRRPYDESRREEAFLGAIAPLLDHPDIRSLEDYRHHYWKNRLEHCLEVAWLSFRIADRLGLDAPGTARGALLHDLFHYDWMREGPRGHGFRHPRIALRNARRITELTPREENIILRHMWPLTPVPPLYPESWIVSAVDTVCCAGDYLAGAVRGLRRRIAVPATGSGPKPAEPARSAPARRGSLRPNGPAPRTEEAE